MKITDPSSNKFRISLNPDTINIFTFLKTNEIKVSTALFLTIGEDNSITGYLNVAGNVNLNKTLTVTTPAQGGGNIRIIPMDNVSESSIGYYTRSDARATEAGDVWICGVNAWGQNIGDFQWEHQVSVLV